MSDETRAKLGAEIETLLSAAAEEANKHLIEGVQRAATSVYQELLCNPWPQLIRENGHEYALISATADHVWEEMLKVNPSKASKWDIKKLIEAWSAAYPSEWKLTVGEAAADQIKSLTERLDFEIKVNRREF